MLELDSVLDSGWNMPALSIKKKNVSGMELTAQPCNVIPTVQGGWGNFSFKVEYQSAFEEVSIKRALQQRVQNFDNHVFFFLTALGNKCLQHRRSKKHLRQNV